MQDTKTLTLPVSKKTIVIKGYMSRRVDQEVQRILLGKNKTHYESEVTPTGNDGVPIQPRTTKVLMDSDPTVTIDADNKLLELMVVSIDTVSTNLADTLQDLPSEDFTYILNQVKGVENDSKVVASDPKAPTA